MNNQRGSTSNLKVKKNHSKKLAQCHDAAKKRWEFHRISNLLVEKFLRNILMPTLLDGSGCEEAQTIIIQYSLVVRDF